MPSQRLPPCGSSVQTRPEEFSKTSLASLCSEMVSLSGANGATLRYEFHSP